MNLKELRDLAKGTGLIIKATKTGFVVLSDGNLLSVPFEWQSVAQFLRGYHYGLDEMRRRIIESIK